MGDHFWMGIPHRYVTKPNRSTQRSIPPWSLNQVRVLIGCGKGGNVTSARWQLTLCHPIWHVSFHSGEVMMQTAITLFNACCSSVVVIVLLNILLTDVISGDVYVYMIMNRVHIYKITRLVHP